MSEPNDCPRLMEAHRLWEGEIEGRHAADMRRHVAECSTCRAASAEWDRLSGLLARGDPAAALASDRRQRVKADLLAACAASLDAADDTAQRVLPRSTPRLRRMPVRAALALVPLALAALWLVHFGRRVPSHTQRPDLIGSRPEVRPPIPGLKSGSVRDETHRRGFGSANPSSSRAGGLGLVQTGVSNAGVGRSRAKRSRNIRRAVTSPRLAMRTRPHTADANVPRRLRAIRIAVPVPHEPPVPRRHHAVILVAEPPADPPIERIVIQADAPRPVPMRTVTHLTVIAAGDLKAPGAQLTIVKSEKEEALP